MLLMPSGYGLSRMHAKRDRAEVTHLFVYAATHRDGYIPDVEIEIPTNPTELDVDFRQPGLFKAGYNFLGAYVKGYWRNGDDIYQLPATDTYCERDRFHMLFFAGQNDPWADTILTFYYDKPVPDDYELTESGPRPLTPHPPKFADALPMPDAYRLEIMRRSRS